MKTNTKRGRDSLSLLNTGALMMSHIKTRNGGSKNKIKKNESINKIKIK